MFVFRTLILRFINVDVKHVQNKVVVCADFATVLTLSMQTAAKANHDQSHHLQGGVQLDVSLRLLQCSEDRMRLFSPCMYYKNWKLD